MEPPAGQAVRRRGPHRRSDLHRHRRRQRPGRLRLRGAQAREDRPRGGRLLRAPRPAAVRLPDRLRVGDGRGPGVQAGRRPLSHPRLAGRAGPPLAGRPRLRLEPCADGADMGQVLPPRRPGPPRRDAGDRRGPVTTPGPSRGRHRVVEPAPGPVAPGGRRLAPEVEGFRLAFEDSAIGMSIEDLDGRFIQVNASLCTMLGYEPERADRPALLQGLPPRRPRGRQPPRPGSATGGSYATSGRCGTSERTATRSGSGSISA